MTMKKYRARKARNLRNNIKGLTFIDSQKLAKAILNFDPLNINDVLSDIGYTFTIDRVVTCDCCTPVPRYHLYKNGNPAGIIEL